LRDLTLHGFRIDPDLDPRDGECRRPPLGPQTNARTRALNLGVSFTPRGEGNIADGPLVDGRAA